MNNDKNIGSELEQRKEKLAQLRTHLIPYAAKFERTHTLLQATVLDEGANTTICGRIVSKSSFGKFMFLKLYDIHACIQISCSKADLGDDFSILKSQIDIGDFIGVEGQVYFTKTNEKTIKVASLQLLSKALRPLPEKFHGIQNLELKYRQRYLDFIATPETRDIFLKRSQVIQLIREYLTQNEFLEIETPILTTTASGAAARPFVTKHNALDIELFMRIAPELYLKQAIAAGFDRVFELGRNFRNEGMDASHLQEFTMLEWYASYWDYNDNITFTKDLILFLLNKVFASTDITFGDTILHFGGEWKRVDFCKELSKLLHSDILDFTDAADLKAAILTQKLLPESELDSVVSIPGLIDLLYKRKIRPQLVQPTILYHYPASLIPLARRNDEDNRVIDMYQLVVCGWEIVKGYSELVDPEQQAQNFKEQQENKALGDDEAFEVDSNFMLAMEHGMPPISGVGIGIDRLVALLCNQATLRNVVLFPIMK